MFLLFCSAYKRKRADGDAGRYNSKVAPKLETMLLEGTCARTEKQWLEAKFGRR